MTRGLWIGAILFLTSGLLAHGLGFVAFERADKGAPRPRAIRVNWAWEQTSRSPPSNMCFNAPVQTTARCPTQSLSIKHQHSCQAGR